MVLTFTATEMETNGLFPVYDAFMPNVISRAIFRESPFLLTATIPSLDNQIHVAFLNCSSEIASRSLEKAIEIVQSSFAVSYAIDSVQFEAEVDAIKVQVAIEQHVLRNLEAGGWWAIRNDSPVLVRGKCTSEFALSNFRIHSCFSPVSSKFAGFGKASGVLATDSELSLIISGNISYLTRRDSLSELTRVDRVRVDGG
jgi:hypothetical protein